MIQIRNNVFETNSSSTHSMVIGPESDFEKWESGELYYYRSWRNGQKFITKEEAVKILNSSSYKNEYTERAIKYLEAGNISEILNEDEDEYDVLHEINEELSNNDIYEYNYYANDYYEYLESEESTYTTPGGEKIRILCHYGYDG